MQGGQQARAHNSTLLVHGVGAGFTCGPVRSEHATGDGDSRRLRLRPLLGVPERAALAPAGAAPPDLRLSMSGRV